MNSKIKFFLIFGLIILSLAVIGYFKSVPGLEDEKLNRPQIEITPQSFDSGDIVYGQVMEYVFKVKNTGSSKNPILNISPKVGN